MAHDRVVQRQAKAVARQLDRAHRVGGAHREVELVPALGVAVADRLHEAAEPARVAVLALLAADLDPRRLDRELRPRPAAQLRGELRLAAGAIDRDLGSRSAALEQADRPTRLAQQLDLDLATAHRRQAHEGQVARPAPRGLRRVPARQQRALEVRDVARTLGAHALPAPPQPVGEVDARLLDAALAQRQGVSLHPASGETRERGEGHVEEDPVVLDHRPSDGADHARHEAVVDLVAELVEDLVEVARVQVVGGPRGEVVQGLALQTGRHEELHVRAFAQVRQQPACVVADSRANRGRGRDQGDAHGVWGELLPKTHRSRTARSGAPSDTALRGAPWGSRSDREALRGIRRSGSRRRRGRGTSCAPSGPP